MVKTPRTMVKTVIRVEGLVRGSQEEIKFTQIITDQVKMRRHRKDVSTRQTLTRSVPNVTFFKLNKIKVNTF